MTSEPSLPSDHLYRLMVEAVTDTAICLLEPTGRISAWNRGAELITGHQAAAAIGQSIEILYPDPDPIAVQRTLANAQYQGDAREAGWRLRRDGERFWAETTYTALQEPGGPLLGYAMRLRDLTSRHLAEENLRTSEQRFRTLFEQSPFVIQLFTPEGEALTANHAWERMWQSKLMDLLGYNLLQDEQLVRAGAMPYIERAFAGEAIELPPVPYDPREHGHEGRHRWAQNFLYPIMDEQGRVKEVVLTGQDVTAQHEAQETIQNQQRWLETVLDLMPVPLMLVETGSAKVLFANQAMQSGMGFALPPGSGIEDLPPDHYAVDGKGERIPYERWASMRAVRGERVEAEMVEWHTPEGVRSLIASAIPLPAMHGHPAAVVLTILDVTELERVTAELKQAVEARNQFLSVASHELKTPLTSLVLAVQHTLGLADTDQLSLAGLKQRLELIHRQSERLTKLINTLLDVSRITAGRLPLNLEGVDLRAVVREAVVRHHEEARKARCLIQLQAPGPIVGHWDAMRLDQVITNLLTNALKFGPGQPVEVAMAQGDGVARLTVRDHGIGIAPADQCRLFQRFERLVSERHFGGIGLGLWIARHNTEALGGTIEVASRLGEGATFTVTLPLAGPEAPADDGS